MALTTKTKTRPTPRKKQTVKAPPVRPGTKAAAMIELLEAKQGATTAEMMEATGWQAHSVRGFLAGSLRKRHGLKAGSKKV